MVAPSTSVELLLCCGRTLLDQAHADRLGRLLQSGPPWERVLDLARHHGLLLMLSAHLSAVDSPAVAATIIERLRNSVKCRERHDVQLPEELLSVAQLLAAQGIPMLPFKGPVLAILAYGNLGLRQSGDLDILVRRQDVGRIQSLLSREGYHIPESAKTDRFRQACALAHPQKTLVVDLHWGFSEHPVPVRIPFDFVWQRRQSIELNGQAIDTLCVMDTLVAICVSGTLSRWGKLKWVCDIAELVRNRFHDIDWPQLLPMARRVRAERMVALGLLLSNRILGAKLEERTYAAITANQAVQSLAIQVEEWLLQEEQPALALDESAFVVRVRDSVNDRIQIARSFRTRMAHSSGDKSVRLKHILGF